LLLLMTVACGIVYFRAWRSSTPRTAGDAGESMPVSLVPAAVSYAGFETASTAVLVSSRKQEEPAAPSASARYRLAGTFSVETEEGNRRPRAILDDTVTSEQKIVGEGDKVAEGCVVAIARDSVTLQTAAGLTELKLEFSPGVAGVDAPSTNLATTAPGTTNRFGCVKVKDDRWQFSRQPLLDYYQELLDEPDRMVAIFDTMKPVRDDKNRITGYIVGIEGEREFFDAVGLSERDIVRQVNSVDMTSRRRAEFFIDEFLKNRMSAVVLEVERDGQRRKQVYQMKDQ